MTGRDGPRHQLQKLPSLDRLTLQRQSERGMGRATPLLLGPHAARSQVPFTQMQNALCDHS